MFCTRLVATLRQAAGGENEYRPLCAYLLCARCFVGLDFVWNIFKGLHFYFFYLYKIFIYFDA